MYLNGNPLYLLFVYIKWWKIGGIYSNVEACANFFLSEMLNDEVVDW